MYLTRDVCFFERLRTSDPFYGLRTIDSFPSSPQVSGGGGGRARAVYPKHVEGFPGVLIFKKMDQNGTRIN
jgi:hypothetical protein